MLVILQFLQGKQTAAINFNSKTSQKYNKQDVSN